MRRAATMLALLAMLSLGGHFCASSSAVGESQPVITPQQPSAGDADAQVARHSDRPIVATDDDRKEATTGGDEQPPDPKTPQHAAGGPKSDAAEMAEDDRREQIAFVDYAFPPTLPDTDWHRTAWLKNDCMRCHETGVETAPKVVHETLPDVALTAKCRSCHVLIPGSRPRSQQGVQVKEADDRFAAFAFPPMMPNSESHSKAWVKDDCMLCHESGVQNAPIVKHDGMPQMLLKSKCRSCHVQIRAIDPPMVSEEPMAHGSE